jgi:hypothetical protein
MTSFNSDYNEVLLLLHLQETRVSQDYKMIREILERMKRAYEPGLRFRNSRTSLGRVNSPLFRILPNPNIFPMHLSLGVLSEVVFISYPVLVGFLDF